MTIRKIWTCDRCGHETDNPWEEDWAKVVTPHGLVEKALLCPSCSKRALEKPKPVSSYVGPGDVIYSPVTGEPCRVTKVSGSVRMLEKPFPCVGGSECICANCSAHRILGLIEPITGPLGRK